MGMMDGRCSAPLTESELTIGLYSMYSNIAIIKSIQLCIQVSTPSSSWSRYYTGVKEWGKNTFFLLHVDKSILILWISKKEIMSFKKR